MSTMPTTSRAAIAVAIAGLTASLLTGCFGNPARPRQPGRRGRRRERHRRRRQPRRRTAHRLPRSRSRSSRATSRSRRARAVQRAGSSSSPRRRPTRSPRPPPPSRARVSPRTPQVAGGGMSAKAYSDAEYLVLHRRRGGDPHLHGHPEASSEAPRAVADAAGADRHVPARRPLIGVIYGAVATLGHRQVLRIGDVVIPWGLVAALVGVLALLVGIRLVARRPVRPRPRRRGRPRRHRGAAHPARTGRLGARRRRRDRHRLGRRPGAHRRARRRLAELPERRTAVTVGA